jgi:hypothetical protein
MGRVETRLDRLEQQWPEPMVGCELCRLWGKAGVRDDFGYEDPPPSCPECGRERPPILRWIHVFGVQPARVSGARETSGALR